MSPTTKSLIISTLFFLPSPVMGYFLQVTRAPMESPYFVACAILALAVLNFIIVALLEQHRPRLGGLTLPALLCTVAVIFMFVTAESLNRFFEHLGYNWLSPFVAVSVLFIYIAIYREKSLALKSHLCLNSIALQILWILGAANKVTMPF